MEKLRFTFTVLAASDGKTNLLCITSIETPDGRVYDIPDDLKPVTKHTDMTKSDIFTKIKNSLKRRHQSRKLWIILTDELRKLWIILTDELRKLWIILTDELRKLWIILTDELRKLWIILSDELRKLWIILTDELRKTYLDEAESCGSY